MTNAYLSVSDFKGAGVYNISSTVKDARILRLLEDVSRQIDRVTKRWFYSLLQTKYLSVSGSQNFQNTVDSTLKFGGELFVMLTADLIAVTSLKEDTTNDGIYETTWAATDYELFPYDADPTLGLDSSKPYRRIEVNRRSNGNQDVFLRGQKRYEIIANWGYNERLELSSATINEGAIFSATDLTLTVSDGTQFSAGETILIDSEQMYITAVSINDLTVQRGVNGTTAATHADASPINRYRYLAAVAEACLMQSGRLFKRASAGFANDLGFGETGQIGPVTGLDSDVKDMLRSLIKPVI